MIETDRLVAAEDPGGREDVIDRAIRPRSLAEYVGQPAVLEQARAPPLPDLDHKDVKVKKEIRVM